MDLQFFWKILSRRKWLILTVMLITGIATYFLVDRLEPNFKSDAQFSTGIIDFKGLNPEEDNFYLQKFSVDISFGNLIELMKGIQNMRFVTSRLLIHDLKGEHEPFATPNPEALSKIEYSEADVEELVSQMENNLESLNIVFEDPHMDKLFRQLSIAYGYDRKNLLENHFVIERVKDTDYIKIECESNNPDRSRFTVANFCSDFLRHYDSLQLQEDDVAVSLLKEQVKEKKTALDKKKNQLNHYRADKQLVDLESQRNAIVTHMTELELQRQSSFEKIAPLTATLKDYRAKLATVDHKSATEKGRTVRTSGKILNLQKQLAKFQQDYVDSGYKDIKMKKSIDLYQKEYNDELNRLAKLEPAIEEDELEKRGDNILTKVMEVEYELRNAKGAVETIDQELARLKNKSALLVSAEATTKGLEQDHEILLDEYKTLNEQLNKRAVEMRDDSYPVTLVAPASLADEPEPDHQMILSGFASVLSGTLCVVLIFFLAFLDMSLNNPNQFQKFTNLSPLGSINKINEKNLDINTLFTSTSKDQRQENFKEALRNIRYIVETSGAQKFLFTSTKAGEGKTFLIVHLAHVLTLKNKKVLLIDANFKNNSLTRMSNQNMELGLLNSRLIGENKLSDDFMTQSPNPKFNLDGVDIIGNKGTHQSASEVFAGKDFHNFIHDLGKNYDYIFIESSAMNNYSDTKELVEYTDKVISVFSAESEIKHTDQESIGFLQSLGNRFMGAILNKVDIKNID